MLDWLFIGLGWIVIAILSPGPIAGSMFLPDLLSEWSLLLWLFGYRPVFTLLVNGTPAKRLLGMYVGDRDGYPLPAGRPLGRELAFLAIAIVALAILANGLFLMFGAEQRSFHDLAAASDVYLDN